MKFVLQPWHLLACIVVGYANREQQQILDYLRTENTIHRENSAAVAFDSMTTSAGAWPRRARCSDGSCR
jgi:hypothetical protein